MIGLAQSTSMKQTGQAGIRSMPAFSALMGVFASNSINIAMGNHTDLIEEVCSVIAKRVTDQIKQQLQCTPTEAKERFLHGLTNLFPVPAEARPEPAPKPKRKRKRRSLNYADFPPDLVKATFYQDQGRVYLKVGTAVRPAGTEVGTNATGRRAATVYFEDCRIPRSYIVFLLTHGRWPLHQIFHRNFDRGDDRPENIAEATHAEVCRSSRVSSRNTAGVKGVGTPRCRNTVKPKLVRYSSSITRNGITRRLGTFLTASEAHRAYCAAADEVHGRFNPSSALYRGPSTNTE